MASPNGELIVRKFNKQEPGEVKTEKRQTRSVLKWDKVKVVHGWIVGPTEWVVTHHYGVTHPCHSILTAGELVCPHCAARRPTRWTGYVPVRTETGQPVCAVVGENVRPVVDAIPVWGAVKVFKGEGRTDPVGVTPQRNVPPWSASLEERQTPLDITPWLLTLWGIPEVIDWAARRTDTAPAPAPVPVPVPVPKAEEADGPAELRNRVREWDEQKRAAGEFGPVDLSAGMLVAGGKRIPLPHEPGKNGKPPPKG